MAENNPIINLNSILDFSTKLNETFDIQFILSSAMLSLMGKLKVAKVSSFISENGYFKQVVSKGSVQNFDTFLIEFYDDFFKIPLDDESYFPLIQSGYKYIITLKHRNKILAFISLGDNLLKNEFSDQEVEYVKIVAAVTASSLANALNFDKLKNEKNTADKKNLLLTTLMEISQDFKTNSSLHEILRIFSLHLMGQLLVNKYAVFLIDENHFEEIINRFDNEIPNNFLQALKSINGVTRKSDLHFPNIQLPENCQLSAVAPMIYRNKLKGFVLIGKRMDNVEFSQENLLFIDILANTLTGALENYRLFQEELEKEKIEKELNLALEIQNNLLPNGNPQINGFDIYGLSKPSRAVGGDYYDFIQVNDTEYLIIIADVAGKGVPASLLMANLQAAIRTIAPMNLELDAILKNINSLLYQNTTSDKFVTLFIGKLDSTNSTFEYSNAGHNPPIIITSDKKIKELKEGGIVLGILNEIPTFGKEKIFLDSGSKILLYTDGLSEAMNYSKNEFGTERILNFLRHNHSSSSSELTDELLSELSRFVGNAEQNDDITLITIIKK